MGIGGLDKEFNAIFRRAFASRVFPPEVVEQLGVYKKKYKTKYDFFFFSVFKVLIYKIDGAKYLTHI